MSVRSLAESDRLPHFGPFDPWLRHSDVPRRRKGATLKPHHLNRSERNESPKSSQGVSMSGALFATRPSATRSQSTANVAAQASAIGHPTTSAGATTGPNAHSLQSEAGQVISQLRNLIDETAHDLKTPLTTVRESVRLVRDGSLGPIDENQIDCLDTAINQCDTISNLLRDLTIVPDESPKLPAPQRRWVTVGHIRSAVSDSLEHAMPSGIELLWDIESVQHTKVFADCESVRRLLVNLINNACQVSPTGKPILVRAKELTANNLVEWSVIDLGPGIPQERLNAIRQRSFSLTGGTGLGLNIAARLAAQHFSELELISQVGFGTEVRFHTPTGGAPAIAEAWCKWRLGFSTQDVDGAHEDPFSRSGTDPLQAAGNQPRHGRISRMDGPASGYPWKPMRSRPNHIIVGVENITPACEHQIVAGTVNLGAACPQAAADQFDSHFESQMKPLELMMRVKDRRWVWIFDTPVDEMRKRLKDLTEQSSRLVPGIRLSWSHPQIIPVDGRRLLPRVSDLLVRETLVAQSRTQHFENNQVRPGTPPIENSLVATARLEEEMRRMSRHLKNQTRTLRRHASHMRPQD
ncbi:MAG: HAMP domain-containing sensor histidine kinase [Planctomycetota bacterium]